MIILNEELRHFAFVFLYFLCDMIGDKGFLQKKIAGIFFVAKHASYRRAEPFAAQTGRCVLFKEDVGDCLLTVPLKIQLENAPNQFCFFRDHFDQPVHLMEAD